MGIALTVILYPLYLLIAPALKCVAMLRRGRVEGLFYLLWYSPLFLLLEAV